MSVPDYNRMEQIKARKDGIKLVNNSGRGQYAKGDAETDDYLIDYKFTEGTSFSLNLSKFKKHRKDAWSAGKEGIFVIEFTGTNNSFAVVDWDVFKELIGDE